MKHHPQQTKLSKLAILALLVAAPTQRLVAETPVRPQRPQTTTPLDIETVLGSLAGSMAFPPGIKPTRLNALPASAVPARAATQTSIHSNSIPPAIPRGPFQNQLDPYHARANQFEDGFPPAVGIQPPVGTVDFGMWWQEALSAPLGFANETLPIGIASLTETALRSSPYIQSILTEPHIRQNDLVIADAEFDALAYIEAKFADTNEPVGSALTTGDNSNRFRDETFSSSAGIRKRARSGGNLEVIQRGGYQDNNSTFLVPNPQGTTRLEINFTQPLLKDRGRAVNNTRVLLAKIDVQLANSEVREELQEHLIDVSRAYWDLFQSRAEWLQRNRLLEGATKLHSILEARENIDAYRRQVLRAQVAVTSRRSDLVRAEARIRNAQARLRLLTGDPQLIQNSRWELMPQDQPLVLPVNLSTREATLTALNNRPDVSQSLRKIQAVSAKVGAAKNQVLPQLDLILSTYVAGLDDKTDTFGAFANQFSDGRPSYAAGLRYEIPIGNRASRARLARNRWELTRATYEFQQTMEVTFAETEIAVRETQTAFDEMATKKQAIDAANREVSYLQQRWELLPDPNESSLLLIEDLLDAQERLADEERAFVRAQVAYAISWLQLRKAMGVLLRFDSAGHHARIASEPSIEADAVTASAEAALDASLQR
ncbi:MAG: TolC family protein [Rubripirellula sp.]